MTQREELLRDFDTLVDNYHASRQETRAILNQYAIGRWVSVDERLPESGWQGMIQTKAGDRWFVEYRFRVGKSIWWHVGSVGEFEGNVNHGYISRWLELDLPEGKA